ncbi:MAG: TIGR01777 family protein [Synechococcales cyanobacterium RM1_1_8]|nr:TIGR01777 family protein [Synechococcales cyanobacterium RM1_1_8]
MKVAITGATGFVGSRLVERLVEAGHQVVVLTRSVSKAEQRFPQAEFPSLEFVAYSPETLAEWQGVICQCQGVINLAGEPIAEKRWSVDQKNEILNSRVDTTRSLVQAIEQAESKPQVFVSGSAIGYYGTSETATFDEGSGPGDDFLAEVCKQWEAEAQKVSDGVRLVILRIGVVLDNGGAVAKMLPAFRAFAGGPIGSGRQWFSWVDREDLVSLIIQALTDGQMQGAYNATSPNPVTMKQMTDSLGEVMGRPSWMPVPGFALELLLGEGAKVVLEGQKVMPKQTQASGFEYEYGELKDSLKRFV